MKDGGSLLSVHDRTEESEQRKQHAQRLETHPRGLSWTPRVSCPQLLMHSSYLYTTPLPKNSVHTSWPLYCCHELANGMELWTAMLPILLKPQQKPYLLRAYFLNFPIERQDVTTLGEQRCPEHMLSPKGTALSPIKRLRVS